MIVVNKSSADDLMKWGFTYAEVEELGIAALNNFDKTYGVDLINFTKYDIKNLYYDIINNPDKYNVFANWLLPRFRKFIDFNISLRIYVGGPQQFINRGNEKLEKSLEKTYNIISNYEKTGKVKPSEITLVFYYLNLIFR